MSLKHWVAVTAVAAGVLGPACTASTDSEDTLGVAQQAVGETVSTDKAAYTVGENVVVTFGGMPGNYYDWVALAPAGAPAQSYTRYAYTYGRVNGSSTFAGPPAGNYVARAFLNNGYTVLAESAPFTIAPQVAPTTVTTSKATYAPSESAVINFTGMAGYQYDWISIAPPGSGDRAYVRWTYTGGLLSGSRSIPLAGLNGTFVARVHFNNDYPVVAESAPFTVAAVGTTVSADKASYAFGETITISYANMQGSRSDWVSVARQGTPADEFSWWEYTGPAFNGSFQLNTLPEGTYVARAFFDDGYDVRAESTPFTVGAPGALPVTLTTDKTTYSGLEPVRVTYSGMSGGDTDWVGGYSVGSDNRYFRAWSYTNGGTDGLVLIYGLRAGTWEMRAFFDDDFVLQGRTAGTITVTTAIETNKTTYAVGETVSVRAGGMIGYPKDWVSISSPGAPQGSAARWQYTGGWPLGTYHFNSADLGPGTYVARAHFDDEPTVRAESVTFTITP